jgi:integrase
LVMRVALTDRFVAGAKATRRAEFFDAKTKGLSLRVSPTAKTWAYHFTTDGGKRARLTLGSFPSLSLAAARGLALEAQAIVQSGQDPRIKKSSGMTVAMLSESYLAKHVLPNLRSARQVERRIRKNVIPIIGNVRLADLHRRDVNRVVDAVMSRDSPIETNRVFGDVHAMVRWAVGRGDLDHDPLQNMPMPNPPGRRDRVLSDDEIRHFWNTLDTAIPNRHARQILRLSLVTAQRVGEVAGMNSKELDLKRATWNIPGSRTKNSHPHSVPLSPLALEIIQSKPEFDLKTADIAMLVLRVQAKFGLPHWTAHDLRRTALTKMAELGVAPIVLGHIANHRTTTKAGITLGVYVHHQYEKEKREALELWADRLRGIISGSGKVVAMRGKA